MCVKQYPYPLGRERTSLLFLHLEDIGFRVYQNKKEFFHVCKHYE